LKASEARKTLIYKTVENTEIPEDIKAHVLNGIISAARREKVTHFDGSDNSIYGAFIWEETREGTNFWHDIHTKYFWEE